MTKLRYGLLALACAGLLSVAAILAFGTNAASGGPTRPRPRAPRPAGLEGRTADAERRQLAKDRADDHEAGVVRDPPHALVADRPEPRDRPRDPVGVRPAAG